MPKRRKKRDKAEPETGAFRMTDTGDTVVFNTDSSLITNATDGDIHINQMIWRGWSDEFDNHVVFGSGAGTVHRFYNNAPGRTSKEMAQPGVIAPFGEPRVEIRGNVLVDTDEPSTSPLIEAGDNAVVQLTNMVQETASTTTNVQFHTSSGTSTGNGPVHARWLALQDYITQGHDDIPTSRAAINQWLGWEELGCRHTRLTYPTAEEEAQQRRSPVYRRARMERKNRRNTAELRAEQLLWNVLDRQQRRGWRAHGYFHLAVGSRRYRIEVRKRAGNVHLVDQAGERLKSYCCHTKDHIPNADNALAQMMMLHHDEAGFLKLANVCYDRDRQRGNVTIDNAGVIYYPGEQAAA